MRTIIIRDNESQARREKTIQKYLRVRFIKYNIDVMRMPQIIGPP